MRNRDQCNFCEPSSRFQPIMMTALYEKYSTSSNFYFSRQIDDLLQSSTTQRALKYNQILFEVNNFEFLKKTYNMEQFLIKIRQFGQYYKFNRDLPMYFDQGLVQILIKYQENYRKINFQRVKNAIKKQQGISISSQHNSSSKQSQASQFCSNISSVLHELRNQNSSDSILLNNICHEIDKKYGKQKQNHIFKGHFEEMSKKFADFLQYQKRKQIQHNFNKRLSKNAKNNNFKNSTTKNPNFSKFQKKKDKADKISQFHLNTKDVSRAINKILSNSNQKYQSNTRLKNVAGKQKNIGKQASKEMKKVKTPNTPQIEKNVETDRLNRQESKKSFRKNSTSKIIIQSNLTNQNQNGHIGNRICPFYERKERESKSKNKSILKDSNLSRSKSKTHLHFQGCNTNSLKKNSRSSSNITESNPAKAKNEKECENKKINSLLNKKLTIFCQR